MSDKKNSLISRRDFLKKIVKIVGVTLVGSSISFESCLFSSSSDPDEDPDKDPENPQLPGRVVHTYSSNATDWDFGTDYYGRHVNQSVVDDMVELGLMSLTGTSSITDAWKALIPDYSPGKAIAIKVNLNSGEDNDCETGCSDGELRIDALMQPVNSVIKGLKQIDVREQDIWIYDASRRISARFISRCLYPYVEFYDPGHWLCKKAEFQSSDPSAQVTFIPPENIEVPPQHKITDVVINASYLINIPIIKKHGVGVTLSFKNHFGSIFGVDHFCIALHPWVYPSMANYSSEYNPLVDIYTNPHIRNKTILTIGDGLFGNWESNMMKPQPWSIFGNNASNSLFFSTDPVSIDCVMTDFLYAENLIQNSYWVPTADEYLVLAAEAGLGVFERGDPMIEPYGSGYSNIHYVRENI